VSSQGDSRPPRLLQYVSLKYNNGLIGGGEIDALSRAVGSLDVFSRLFSRKRANGPRKVAITRRQMDWRR